MEPCGDAAILLCLDDRYHADCGEAFERALKDADGASPSGRVVLDLTAVALLSSAALRALRSGHEALAARGGALSAGGGGDLVFGVLRFAPFMKHYDTIETAVAAFSAPGKDQA
ncbi:MAG: hypothetical protein AAGF90_16285 [Pseudomonadota bacterium]